MSKYDKNIDKWRKKYGIENLLVVIGLANKSFILLNNYTFGYMLQRSM